MLVLGDIGGAHCATSWTSNSLSVTGSRKGFLGYKLGSISSRNGIFAEWNTENDRLTLSNDKFGMLPIYYIQTSSGVDFSSAIVNLLEEKAHYQLDDAAIAVFLRTGSFIGHTTPFLNIKALPPGAILSLDKDGLRMENEKISCGRNATTSRKEAEEIYGEMFHNSVSKFQAIFSRKRRLGVPLSGGRDSRHILLALMSSGLTPYSCITMKHRPPKSDEDAKIASDVCSVLKIKHIVLEQDISLLRMETNKNILTNFCSMEHSWILPLSRYLFEQGYDAIFDGIGGDVLSAGLFLTERRLALYRREKYEELANDILNPEGVLPDILSRTTYRRFNREIAVDLLVNELKEYTHLPNPLGQFFFWNRTRRHIALCSWGILQKRTYVFAPYLDHELYEFLSSLPAEYFLDHMFHQNAIARRYPGYAHIPYERKTGLPTEGRVLSNYFQIIQH